MKKIPSILLVDDDPASNYLAKLLLLEIDPEFDIHVRYHGQEALEYIKAADGEIVAPNLIFLDLNMPVMDGFEFLEHFTQLPASESTSIVLLTSSAYPKDIERAKAYNITHFINKPLTEEQLREVLANVPLYR
jgi:CheY-like chemotaxis protein